MSNRVQPSMPRRMTDARLFQLAQGPRWERALLLRPRTHSQMQCRVESFHPHTPEHEDARVSFVLFTPCRVVMFHEDRIKEGLDYAMI